MTVSPTNQQIEAAYNLARERYALLGVDTEQALATLGQVALSLHCWQGDDVGGFEATADELRRDLDQAYRLIPGAHRLNLHAMYAETGGRKVERNQLRPEHFDAWTEWASGFTLASYDEGIRTFWIEHCIACRQIGAHFGRELGTPAVTNIWVPDGFKDTPADRKAPRQILKESLDKVLAEPIDPRHNLDAVEPKLFGLGAESYTVGSHEFYMGYAITKGILMCLDAGHFHPTETISDKISAVLMYLDELLLHVSRGVRWDSDHVVTFTDDLQAIAQEIVRGNFLKRVHIGLDYFDASINRVAAWAIGARNTLRALLLALLEPIDQLRDLERAGDYTGRLALLEELKSLPFGAVWDAHCLRQGVPVGFGYVDEIRAYERRELSQRG